MIYDIWDKEYRPHLVGSARQRIDIEGMRKNLAAAKAKAKWTHYSCQFIWENLRASLGDVGMSIALLDDPDWIHDFNRVYTDLYKEIFTLQFAEIGTSRTASGSMRIWAIATGCSAALSCWRR